MLPPTWECDHIIPLWKIARYPELVPGDPNHLDNLQPLCPNCHKLKTLEEAIELEGYTTMSQVQASFEPSPPPPSRVHECPRCNLYYSPYFTHECWVTNFQTKFSWSNKE